jgi:hypothetical protein
MVFDACSSRISQAHGEERSLLLTCLLWTKICCLHIISRHHRRRILLRRKTKYSYCDKRGATRKELIFSLNYNIANITRGRVEVMKERFCCFWHFSLFDGHWHSSRPVDTYVRLITVFELRNLSRSSTTPLRELSKNLIIRFQKRSSNSCERHTCNNNVWCFLP